MELVESDAIVVPSGFLRMRPKRIASRLPDNHELLKILKIGVEAEALEHLVHPVRSPYISVAGGDKGRWFIGGVL